MQKLFNTTLTGVMLAGLSIGLVGCTDEASVTKETVVKDAGGTAKITEKKTIDTSGKNPPAVTGGPTSP